MNRSEAGLKLSEDIKEYIDTNNMVNSRPEYKDSGNGLYMSAVYVLLMNDLCGGLIDGQWFARVVKSCEVKPGLISKAPRGGFATHQQTFDDLLGIAGACAVIGNKAIPRSILWALIKNFGFYPNVGETNEKSFLASFIQVWVIMWPAAFPWLRYPLAPLMWVIARFMNPRTSDGSGRQLIWAYLASCHALGITFKKYYEMNQLFLTPTMLEYYGPFHPFINASRAIPRLPDAARALK